MLNIDKRAMKLACTQGGVLTRRQALAIGMTDRMIFHRTARGSWERVAQGAYSLYPSSADRWPLAVAVAKLNATVSHEAAAEVHGFPSVPPGRLVVTVPHRFTNRCERVVVHESTDLIPDHVMSVAQLPVTTPERTVIDLAAVLRPRRLRSVVNAAMYANLVHPGSLRTCFDSLARRGKPGVAALRAILDEQSATPEAIESELERRFYQLIRESGLPEPVLQLQMPWRPATSGRVDFAFPEALLIVECDGQKWHTAIERFELDRRRDNLAQLAGWRVLRFTWSDVTRSPGYVIDAVRSALLAQPAA